MARMGRVFASVILVAFVITIYEVQCLKNALTIDEINRFTNILQEHKPKSLEDVYHVVKALKALGKEVPSVEDVCNYASTSVKQDVKSIFQYSEVVKTLNCKSVVSKVDGFDDKDASSIAYAVAATSNLGLKVQDSLVQSLKDALKNDDTPANAAIAFYAGGLLPKETNLKFLVDLVEDIIAQADEVDSSILKFEGGLAITSAVIRGILSLADGQNKISTVNSEQITKFAQYFLDRKYVMDVKSIFDLSTVLAQLCKNMHQVPVLVSVFKTDRLTEQNRVLKVRVTDVMDNSIADVKVMASSVTSSDGNTIAENVPLAKGKEDEYITFKSDIAKAYIAAHPYLYDFAKADRGIYTLTLDVQFSKNSGIYIGGKDVEVKAKVVSRVTVSNVEIGVADREQSAASKPIKVTFPDSIGSTLEADYHQKVIMNFELKDLAGNPTPLHQVFVRLTHISTGQEIFFVAQAEDNVYKFVLDLGTTGKDSFNNLSGKYKMDLIVGDKLIQIPIKWSMATLSLTFSEEPKKSKKQMRVTTAQPEIHHMFRIPDKRPPIIVSNVFTALIGVPFLIMLIWWIRLGVNVSNFQFSIYSLMFHIGLAGIFALYFMFWTKYNMFTTLKYLCIVGGITFVGGNNMLSAIAARRESGLPFFVFGSEKMLYKICCIC